MLLNLNALSDEKVRQCSSHTEAAGSFCQLPAGQGAGCLLALAAASSACRQRGEALDPRIGAARTALRSLVPLLQRPRRRGGLREADHLLQSPEPSHMAARRRRATLLALLWVCLVGVPGHPVAARPDSDLAAAAAAVGPTVRLVGRFYPGDNGAGATLPQVSSWYRCCSLLVEWVCPARQVRRCRHPLPTH